MHKNLSEIEKKNLNRIFSVQSVRRVNNDFTIRFKNKWHQLTELQPITVRTREAVFVEEWLDGVTHFSLRGKYLNYTVLPERPKKINKQPLVLTTHRLNWIPTLKSSMETISKDYLIRGLHFYCQMTLKILTWEME